MKYSVAAGTLHILLGFLEQHGLDRTQLCKTLQLDETVLKDPDGRIPTAKLQILWRTAIETTGKPWLPLEAGAFVNPYTLGILSYLLMNTATLGMAIDKLCQYQDISCAGIRTVLERHGTTCRLRLEVLDADIVQHACAVESELSVYLTVFKGLTGTSLVVQQADFAYTAPANPGEHERVFGTKNIVFNSSFHGITFAASELERPVLHANASLFPLFEKHATDTLNKLQNADTMSYRIRQAILGLLKGDEPRLANIARTLGIGERTIQLKLQEEGTTFRELLDDVRKEMAIAHLRENKSSTTDIAFLLGFSEPSVFSRTFKKWTGLSPQAYRKTLA
jgi:AraC-like DNA-binding protein